MRFHVRYASGTEHDVDLTGTIATLGRDPSCDLVLNDPKCSRRHAVLEGEPGSLSIRDSGSANGVFVNGKRVDRTPLVGGDVIQVGEVFLTVLEEPTARTVVMEAEDLDLSPTSSHPPGALDDAPVTRDAAAVSGEGPRPIVPKLPSSADLARPLPPPPPPPIRPAGAPPESPLTVPPPPEVLAAPPRPRPAVAPPPRPLPPPAPPRSAAAPPAPPGPPRPAAQPLRPEPAARAVPAPQPAVLLPLAPGSPGRSLAVTALAGAAGLNAVLSLALAFVVAIWAPRGFPLPPALAAVGAGLVAIVSGVLAAGFALRAPWARAVGIVAAGAGVPTCALTPISIATLAYLLRDEARIHFLPAAERARAERERGGRPDDGMDLAFAGAIAGAAALGLMLGAVLLWFAFGTGAPAPRP
ncbi:MAG: FHA domain-containing protein [Vicinamibacteria bacterium]|nr:FHA domain-containing protein [Vicinamibacteria bacterium]